MNDPITALEPSADATRQYHDEGFVLLSGLLSSEDTAALRDEVMGIMEIIGLGATKLKQSGEYLAGSALDGLIHSPKLKSVASALMGGPSSVYLPFTAVKSGDTGGGGGGEFHFHQDNQYTRFDNPGINLWFALTPMTAENGALRVVPRSHLHGTLPSEQSPDKDGHKKVIFDPTDFVPIVMNPGDCIAFTRLTVHGSGPNSSPEHRVAYAVQFHRDDVNYTLDNGETWKSAKENPRWSVGPVEKIRPPQGKLDGH